MRSIFILLLAAFLAASGSAAPNPKLREGGPVEIDFSPLDGQLGAGLRIVLKAERSGKEAYYQAFDARGAIRVEQLCESVTNTLRGAGFEVEAVAGGKIAVKKYKKSELFTFRVDVEGLPADAKRPTIKQLEKKE